MQDIGRANEWWELVSPSPCVWEINNFFYFGKINWMKDHSFVCWTSNTGISGLLRNSQALSQRSIVCTTGRDHIEFFQSIALTWKTKAAPNTFHEMTHTACPHQNDSQLYCQLGASGWGRKQLSHGHGKDPRGNHTSYRSPMTSWTSWA